MTRVVRNRHAAAPRPKIRTFTLLDWESGDALTLRAGADRVTAAGAADAVAAALAEAITRDRRPGLAKLTAEAAGGLLTVTGPDGEDWFMTAETGDTTAGLVETETLEPGRAASNEVQAITLDPDVNGGTLRLQHATLTDGDWTAPIAWNATAAEVAAAVAAVRPVGLAADACAFAGAFPAAVTATFGGTLAATPVPLWTIDAANLLSSDDATDFTVARLGDPAPIGGRCVRIVGKVTVAVAGGGADPGGTFSVTDPASRDWQRLFEDLCGPAVEVRAEAYPDPAGALTILTVWFPGRDPSECPTLTFSNPHGGTGSRAELPFTDVTTGSGVTVDSPAPENKNVYAIRLPGPWNSYSEIHYAADGTTIASSTSTDTRDASVHDGYRLRTPWGTSEQFGTNTKEADLRAIIGNLLGNPADPGAVEWDVSTLGDPARVIASSASYDVDGDPVSGSSTPAGSIAGPGFLLHVRPYWAEGEDDFPRKAETGPIELLQGDEGSDPLPAENDPRDNPPAAFAVQPGRVGRAGLVEARVGAPAGSSTWYPPGPGGADGVVGTGSPVTVSVGDSAATLDAALTAAVWPLSCASGTGTPADPWVLTTATNSWAGRPAADDGGLFGGGDGQATVLTAGGGPLDAQYRYTLRGDVSGGRIAWSLDGVSSIPLTALAATAAEHAAAVNAVLGSGAVAFAGAPGGPWTATFGGAYAGAPAGPLTPLVGGLVAGDGTQRVRAATVQPASGPEHWNDPLNWVAVALGSDAVPESGDEVVLEDGTDHFRWGLRQFAAFTALGDDPALRASGESAGRGFHDFRDGQRVTLVSFGPALPGGLSAGTVYTVNDSDPDDGTLQLLDAGGAVVTPTDSGGGAFWLGVRPAKLVKRGVHGGSIGLPEKRDGGRLEHLNRVLALGPAIVLWGDGPGEASGGLELDTGPEPTVCTFRRGAARGDAARPTLNWSGSAATLILSGSADLGVGTDGRPATFAALTAVQGKLLIGAAASGPLDLDGTDWAMEGAARPLDLIYRK